jgi:hypothetical protein
MPGHRRSKNGMLCSPMPGIHIFAERKCGPETSLPRSASTSHGDSFPRDHAKLRG